MRIAAAAAALSLGIAGCQPAPVETEGPAAAAPPAAAPAAADRRAQVAAVVALTAQDLENCTLPERVEREARAIDLGDGTAAVIVTCSVGMRDAWSRLYLIRPGQAPERVPLVQYDIQGDGLWRAEFAAPNLEWLPDERLFAASIRGARGCGSATRWRWDGRRVALVEQTVQDCDLAGEGNLPAPRVVWPTSPATPEPAPAD